MVEELKWKKISILSRMSTPSNDYLLNMLDHYNKINLQDLDVREVMEYISLIRQNRMFPLSH